MTKPGLDLLKEDTHFHDVYGYTFLWGSFYPDIVHDRLFFANLTNQVYQDILQLNNSGLFVYQYNNNQQDYLLIHHHSEFTQLHSWLPRYTDSIQLVDLNSDGHEDLLFTGPRGLTALTFDSTATTWRSLLNPDKLSVAQRYATVVGTLPAMPPTILQPSIFTQDAQGKVQWATVTQNSNSIQPEEQQIPATTIVKSELSSSPQLPPRSNSEVIPKQITRTTLSQKPTLRWTEQWGNEFLKEPIDMASGQVQFSVPLVDTSAGLQLALFYHSQETSTELLGMGWSIPLAQDYIIVDYKGSIYSEDADYYLITQGRPQRLQHITSEGEIRRFQLAEQSAKQPQVTIEYHQSAQRWNIEYPTEQAIYGKANHTTAADALQWSLTWPNWRGPGHDSDKTQLQPLITAWYLNARLAKHHQQALYYYYEIDNATIGDSKTYTAAIRLKTISDNQQMRLLFNYAAKTQAEYTAPNPIDKEGNIVFPVELAQKHYLQGYSITTASYHQVLQFVYQINDKQRLLTAIQQQLSGYQEPVLQFSYQRSLDKQVLKSCTLPCGATVNFSYETIVPPASTVANVFSYPVTETAKITYGPDYAVMAYRNLDKIILRIMNREMTRTIINCSEEASLSCPTAQSEIKNYMLRAYHNLFIVSVESDQRKLYIFDRYNQTWSAKPVFSFTKEALINFDETTIAVAEPNSNNLRLFKRLDNQADWNETTLRVPRAITRLTLRQGLVVGYDDKRLWRFYLDSRQQWQSSVLEDNLDNNTRQILARFNLTSDTQIYKEFNQNDLQIFNNFILLSSLKENHGQLSSSINLFLLDTQYNIVQRQSFEIQRENILSLTYDIKEKNSIFQLGYVQEGGYFKIRIKALFGDVIKGIGQDAMTEWIRQHNQKSEEFLKKGNLINWNLYFTGINQQGVYCSNDILLRMTGTKCQRQLSPKMFLLGKHFVLEELTVDNKSLFKLYKQDSNQNKQGQPLRELQGQVINHYPAYIAYQPTPDSVKVLTFKDEQTLDQDLTFNNEQLVESDWQNLVTIANASTTTMVHAGPQECLVRPLSTLIRKPDLFVNQMNLTAGGVQRLTGYQRSFRNDLQYSKTTTLKIPGANKSLFGWYEETTSYHVNSGNLTKTQRWFDAARQQVLPVEKQPSNDSTTIMSSSSETNSSLLWDRSNQLLISDFSPYRLADDMAAYYGFESYENNQIGNSSIAKNTWHLVGAQIIKKGFAFTGENYLQLNSTTTTSPAYLEGIFQPRDQDTTYLASCWLRGSIPLTLNTPVSYLKAILSTTTGQEISRLLAQVKQQLGDWFYLELPIDFQVIKQIYQDYVTYSAKNNTAVVLPSLQDVRFRITLRVEADPHQRVDLDHIRFSPFNHDFQATIYQPLTEQLTAVIQANGLVERTIYNRLDQEIASLQEDGQLKQFSSGSKTGLLVPTPQGKEVLANQPPTQLNFQPEGGFYETFDAYALRSRWKLDNPAAWCIAPGQLWHEAPRKHRIKADARLFDGTSAAIRCYFALQKPRASLSFNWKGVGSFQFTRQSDNFTTLTLPNKHFIKPLPLAGELIIMLEQNQAWLWLDGVLLLDQLLQISGTAANLLTPWSSFFLEAQGQVLIEDCLVMNNPALQIEYYNAFGETTQVIQLEDANTADVTEKLYDQLGRPAITTKTTRIHRELGQPLLIYRPNFVSNINPVSQQSVWHTGRLEGEVDRLNPNDQGVAYARTQYAPNPLNEESVLGLAGLDFSVTGPYATHLSRHANIAFLSNLFPTNQGYRQKVESLPNGSQYVAIFDKHNNQVARYTRVPSYNSLLSTYEYDSENRLIKILPPLYHEKVDTASKLTPWQPGEAHLSPQEKQWQQALGTFLSYDLNGNLIRKITPDSGKVEYLYNSVDQMRFMISLGAANQTEQIVYFDYDMHGQLSRTGHLKQLLSIDALQQYLESQSLPHTQDYQLFDYADDHLDPVLRGRIKNCTTYNPDQPVAEEIRFNSQEQVIAKSTLTMSEQTETDKFPDFTKQYVGDKVRTLEYPITVNGQLLRLVYHYNRLGQLVKLGIAGNQNHYISFSYHGSGQLASEQDHLNTSYNFTRSYRYNSPGFLEQLSDPFLTEDITYTKKGYGQAGFGDGMVMQTVFNASWPANADGRWFQIQEDMLASNHSATCIQALKRTGYLTINGQPKKLYIRKMETALPLVCGGKTAQKIVKLIAEKQPPGYYGHRYAYGNHQELVKAKYFTADTEALINPLQPDSFTKEIPNLTPSQSQDIWQLLTNASYIITDQQRIDPATAIGKGGKSFLRDVDLQADLKKLNDNYTIYVEPIKRLIIATISQQRTLL
uniref:Uncharacterized protein n=1 Tax=Acrobeloides nanus TaxID=290746 RepID=A0A914DKC4_9BILA